MTWDKAPREPRPVELFQALAPITVTALLLTDRRSWWLWVLLGMAVVGGVGQTLRWVRDNRTHRAWVAWDEAGGPDAQP